MPKVLFAEELLALVTDRNRAETIAGDLVEEAGRRGPLWFAGALGGVALALFFAAFGAARARMLGLLAAGLAVSALLYVAVRVSGVLLGLQPPAVHGVALIEASPAALLYLAASLAAANFLTGLVLGRARARSGPSAVMPLALFWAAVGLVALCADLVAGQPTWYCTLVYLGGIPSFYIAPLLAGAALAARPTGARSEPLSTRSV